MQWFGGGDSDVDTSGIISNIVLYDADSQNENWKEATSLKLLCDNLKYALSHLTIK